MTTAPISVERVEHRWAAVSVVIIVLLVVMAIFAGLHQAAMPQSRVETVDPRTLASRRRVHREQPGQRARARRLRHRARDRPAILLHAACILVPTDTPVTFRVTSADVVHGFLITGTNINLMLVPGYISSLTARFETPGERLMPCHEFCGMGHEGMWGRIKVVDKAAFARLAADRRRLSCVE